MKSRTVNRQGSVVPEFLSGGGEMGALIRSKDWSKTPLGSPDTWPQSLRTTVSTCLNSRFPILIWWGPELVMIYNDAYRPILGTKHPASMGEKGKAVWPEVWGIIGPMLHGVYEQGISTWSENQLLLLERNGYAEECYFTFSYSPIYVESGGIGGVYCAVTETTQTVLNERQSQTLRDLSNVETMHKTVDSVYAAAARALENNKDFPFAAIYKIENEGNAAWPVAYAGIDKEQKVFPNFIDIANPVEGTLNFLKAFQTSSMVLSENKGRRKNLPLGAWEKEATHFVHIPITNAGNKYPHAILSAALNPHRQYDASFRQFTKLIADQIALEINNVLVYEEERKRAEALAEIDKAKTLFFSNISHEFRTPLTLMLGSLEELLNKSKEELNEPNRAKLETSHRNAMRLLRLVNNLLDFSRIEAGRIKARYQLTDIAKYTTDTASTFRSLMEHAGLSFHIKTDAIIQPVYIDREMWEKIVLNLLSNAFKYTLEGNVTLSLTTASNHAVLKIKDTGVGIPQSELPKMFQRFHRVQNAVGRTYEGTGIGLSLVSELVKLHGGEITVSSKEGRGSEFTVAIPTGKSHLPTEQVLEKALDFDAALADAFVEEATTLLEQPLTAHQVEETTAQNLSTVLVVDDNADMREHLKAILSKQYHVITANNGMDALHRMEMQLPGLIVSDIMMPVMDGIQLLKAVKENTQTNHIPVILLSARAGEESKIEGYDIGADDYLVKPFSAKELLARVRAHINMAQTRQDNEQKIKNFFMQAPAAIAIVHGPEHVYTLANLLYQKLFSRTEEQLIGRSIRQVWPEIEGQGIYELFNRVFTSGQPYIAHEFPASFMEKGSMKNGYYDFVAQPIKNSEGRVTDILIHAFEVTEQINAKKQVEESQQQLTFAIDAAELGTWDFDPATNKFSGNERLKEWFGLKPEEEIELPLALAAIAGKDRENVRNAIQTALQYSSGGHYDVVYSIIHPKTKKERIVRAKGKASFTEEKIAYRFNGTLQDVTEEVIARRAVLESETRLRLAIASAQLGTFEIDLVHPSIIFSERLAEIFGLDPTQKWTHKDLKEALHPDDVPTRNKAHEKALKTGWLFYEARVIGKDGSVRWIRINGRVLYEAGIPVRMYGMAMDITEEKRKQQLLKENEERFRTLAETLPQLVWITDEKGKQEYASSRWKEFTGIEPQGWQSWQQMVHPHDRTSITKAWLNSLETGSLYRTEARLKNKDGAYRWHFVHGEPIKNSEGKIIKWIGAFTDVHNQKTLSENLEKLVKERTSELTELNEVLEERNTDLFNAQNFLQTVLDSSVELVAAFDTNLNYTFINKKAEDFINKKAEDITGKNITDVHPGIENTEHFQHICKALSGQHIHVQQREAFSREGTILESYLLPLKEGNQIVGVISLQRDVTTFVRLSEDLKQSNLELERSNEDLQQFAHVASHDLKEPLRKIKTFGNRLRTEFEEGLPEKGKTYISKMETAANRMYDMIDGVLLYSSLNAAQQTIEEVDLNRVLGNIESDLEVMVQQKQARIEYTAMPVIKASGILMHQLFYNLINNALKFSSAGKKPHITIQSQLLSATDWDNKPAMPAEHYVQIVIKDNGIGFDQAQAEKIFKTFTRLNSKDQYEGTGLGLALCKKIVERHHGLISAEGKEGEGATFTILLPLK